jgi:hypothetical protein
MKRRTIMKTTFFVTLATILCLLLMSCHGSDLTRAKAKRMLQQFGSKQSFTNIGLTAEEMGRLASMRDADAVLTKFFMSDLRRCAPNAKTVLSWVGPLVECSPVSTDITSQNPGTLFTLKIPIHWIVVDVTGIANAENGPNEKLVEITWKYDFSTLSKEVEDAIQPPINNGTALFRLYDDGWRVVKGI